MSPWEAVRFSLEAQRLIALQFFPFSLRKEHQEEAFSDKKAVVPGLGSPTDLPIPLRSRKTARAKTVAARSATDIRKLTASRKLKRSKRKRKNNKQRG
jgi:hypothetical protein